LKVFEKIDGRKGKDLVFKSHYGGRQKKKKKKAVTMRSGSLGHKCLVLC